MSTCNCAIHKVFFYLGPSFLIRCIPESTHSHGSPPPARFPSLLDIISGWGDILPYTLCVTVLISATTALTETPFTLTGTCHGLPHSLDLRPNCWHNAHPPLNCLEYMYHSHACSSHLYWHTKDEQRILSTFPLDILFKNAPSVCYLSNDLTPKNICVFQWEFSSVKVIWPYSLCYNPVIVLDCPLKPCTLPSDMTLDGWADNCLHSVDCLSDVPSDTFTLVYGGNNKTSHDILVVPENLSSLWFQRNPYPTVSSFSKAEKYIYPML